MAECEDTFVESSKAIFRARRSKYDPRRAVDFIKANGKFDEQPLENLVKKKMTEAELEDSALLKDEREDSCKV
jgi:hypothetical protein